MSGREREGEAERWSEVMEEREVEVRTGGVRVGSSCNVTKMEMGRMKRE